MPELNDLIGKTVVLGLTFTDADGNERERTQRHGVVEVAEHDRGIGIRFVAPGRAWDGELYWLPPDARPFREAAPGAYRLRSTGETIVDPDFTAAWVVSSPSPEDDTPERREARREDARRYGFPPD
jgi:hypothetical protein